MPISDAQRHSDRGLRAAAMSPAPRFTAGDLLALWEAGVAAEPAARPSALLAAAGRWLGAELPADGAGWEALPLGERDQWLLRLRQALFGRELTCHAACPACGEALELVLDIEDLLRPADEPPPPAEIEARHGDLRLAARPPTGADLRALAALSTSDAAAGEDSSEAAARQLALRCLVRAERHGEAVEPASLTAAELAVLEEALAAADPRAELRFGLTCEACDERWSDGLDVAAYLAAELEIAAHRLLRQVATLARGFGWREGDVLALSPLRRRAYLDLLGA